MHVWGAMKALEIAKEYKELKWRNHPKLAGFQMCFVLKRKTDPEGVESLKRCYLPHHRHALTAHA